MSIVLIILPIAAIVVWVLLARGVPKQQAIPLFVVSIILAALAFGVGWSIGEISPTYRGNIAVQEIVRQTRRTLDAGECDRARSVYAEAHDLLQKGGKPQEAVTLLRSRLQTPGNHAESAPAQQP
jgi:hypothetical protein